MSVITTQTTKTIRSSKRHRAFNFWILALTVWLVLLLLHPIIAPDFWWQLARGREVWAGNIAPSRALLSNEVNFDADWLGGLPWYLLYEQAGPAVLSLIVTIIVISLALQLAKPPKWFSVSERGGRSRSLQIFIVFLGFAASRQSWGPTPLFFDACGVIAVWSLAGRLCRKSLWLTFTALLVSELIWANSGTIPLLGPVIALLRINLLERDQIAHWKPRSQALLLVCLLVLGSLTPRGIWTEWDSVRLIFPWISTDLGTLRAAGMLPFSNWPQCVEVTAFLILFALNLALLVKKSSDADWFDLIVTVTCAVVAGSSASNLGSSSLLLMLATIQMMDRRHATEPTPKWFVSLSAIGVTAFAMAVAGGFWPGMQTRLGWGLAPQMEPSILEKTMSGLSFTGSAYCTGAREAGFLVWLRPGTVKPMDFPTRALLSGRLKDHVSLGWELANSWRDQHRRSDGTWSGWLKRFRENHVRLLVISADDVAVIRALEPTPWKPLAIDAPCVPYGVTVDASINRKLAQIQDLLDIAELGEWTYPELFASGVGSHFDLWGLLTGVHDLRIDHRQSRTLVAMNKHIAGLKVLTHGLRRNDPATRHEFCSIQMALAYRDFLAAGQTTGWRLSVCLETGADPAIVNRFNPKGSSLLTELPQGYQSAVTAYIRRDFAAAKKPLSEGSSESLLALSQISLEEGNPQQAGHWLKELKTKFPESTEFEAVRDALAQFFR